MKRKILKVGGYSFMVALPKEWVKNNCKSDYLDIEEKDGVLVLKPIIKLNEN